MTTRQESRDNYLKAVGNGDAHFEGMPCKKEGHTTRYTSNRNCVECKKLNKNKEYNKEYNKKYKQSTNGKKKQRKSVMKDNYGITPEDWILLYEEQNGICKNPDCNNTSHNRWWEQGYGGFCVDHDHKTKEVRGLLCSECNILEGFVFKNPKKTWGIIQYRTEWDNRHLKKCA